MVILRTTKRKHREVFYVCYITFLLFHIYLVKKEKRSEVC